MTERARVSIFCLAGAATMIAIAGCHSSYSSSPYNPGPQPTTYEGTLTGSGSTSGKLSMTITPPAAALQPSIMPLTTTTDSVSGSFQLVGGAPIALSGTFTTPNGPLTVSGGGYSFTGNLSGSVLSGTWTGPGTSGTFTALTASGYTGVTVFCGTFTGTNSGVWNLALSGSALTGSYSGSGGSGVLNGSLSGAAISLDISQGGTATGTLAGDTVSGTWDSGGSGSGSWSGSTSGCN